MRQDHSNEDELDKLRRENEQLRRELIHLRATIAEARLRLAVY
jgi:hypothetical protein